MGRSRPACGTTPTIQPLPKKTPGPPAGQNRPRKTFLVHPWPPARPQASPPMPPAPKALEVSDKLIDAQVGHAATISAGEWITASGEWINDRTHGQQFKARFLRSSAPTSTDGIEKYLASGMIRGIGPVYARKLV